MSKIIRIFLKKIFIEGYNFRDTLFVIDFFLKTSIFKPPYFLKWRPIFDNFYSTEFKTPQLLILYWKSG
jgi:hypothetical protein